MRDAVGRSGDARKQFDPRKDQDEPFGLERDRREDQREDGVRIEHRVADQHAVDGAGGSERGYVRPGVERREDGGVGGGSHLQRMQLEVLHAHVQRDSAQPRYEVEQQEPFRPDGPLQYTPEDEEGVHVEEDVPEPAVHEHVRQGLPPPEQGGRRVEQGEGPHHEVFVEQREDEHDHVDDDQVPRHHGNRVQEGASSASTVVV